MKFPITLTLIVGILSFVNLAAQDVIPKPSSLKNKNGENFLLASETVVVTDELFSGEAEIIADLYKEDRIDFIKALNLSIDGAPHLVYIFRVRGIFEDEDEEFNEVKSFGRLNEVELEAANTFYSMYKNICNT